uniref:SUN domain-containing ossification factor n=1 Tax=Echeneis naucrates TaxID=173247 RepID=A0A665VW55_ECHNA
MNPQEVEVEESKPDPVSDTVPNAPEPQPQIEPHTDVDLQSDTQDHDQDFPAPFTPEPVPAQDHVSTDATAQAEIYSDVTARHPNLHSNPSTSPDDAENTPTSQSASPALTGAVRVVSAGDELPVDNFVSPEHSDSQSGVIPSELATCENSPFGSPLLRAADIEDQRSDQGLNLGTEAEVQVLPGHVDQEQQQEQRQQKLEGGLSDLDREGNTSHRYDYEQQAGDASIARETDPSVPSKEDIPTFDEWKKQVMEVEKEKSQSLHTSTSGSPHPVKKVQKNFKNNYASVECGAKILSANNEAKSTSAILMENMDLYMLNPCSNKIWFVIELCEPIQVKQLDIANFELFSSTPKDFLVSISDRYPTNKWVKLGTFHARDERIVQSFPLDEQLYAKYVKVLFFFPTVELLSHFGSEHFCPLSLIRVFGTSMVEEYEEIADSQYPSERLEYLDEDYDYPPGYQPTEDKSSKNLLGSATSMCKTTHTHTLYRKQMEEMQRAFNKTIIKLQNTSRIAEEQDQRQTESIQVLQSQLENVTKLMLNLTAAVGQLQREVSDRQSYLVVSLVLCLSLGLLLCLQCCRSSSPNPSTTAVALPKSNHYPSPKRCFSSYDDMSLKRRVACPLVRSKSFHLSSTEVGPDDLYIVEPLRFSPEKKKKRCKTKSLDKVETLKASDPPASLTNGSIKCNGFHPCLPESSSLPTCSSKEIPSETSSCCSSTHSEESYTSRLPPPSPTFPPTGLCNGLSLSYPLQQPPAKSRQEKRSTKRRKSRQTELQFPHVSGGGVSSLPSLQQLMKGNKEISVGTIRVTAVTGHV